MRTKTECCSGGLFLWCYWEGYFSLLEQGPVKVCHLCYFSFEIEIWVGLKSCKALKMQAAPGISERLDIP